MKQKILSCLLAFATTVLPFIFSGCGANPGPKYQMELEVWGVFDDSDFFSKINQEYKRRNPQIKEIRYKKISSIYADYEKELFDAIASGKGPDVFFFSNTWLSQHQNKITPMPDSENNLATFKENFVDVAYADFVKDGQIYAMPLDCDTLALYYNKDLLNQAGIANPPKTWEELAGQISQLTKIDSYGNISQSAIALGRSKKPGDINRASDVLMLLMLQGGAKMFDTRTGQAAFDKYTDSSNNPGVSALEFYTQFSLGSSDFYTWNSKMDYSIDSFRYGKTAMMINYSYWADRFKKTDPKLDFDVAPVLQLDTANQVNFANYWGLAATKNKELPTFSANSKNTYTNNDRIAESWKYIQYVTEKPQAGATFDPTAQYIENSKKAPARRDLIEKNKSQVFWKIFADQALTAKSWPQPEADAVEDIFTDMIDDTVNGRSTAMDAVQTGASRVNALIRK
jgi:ABC-type glycerol-3-phosphate transport system substrate-binding protein